MEIKQYMYNDQLVSEEIKRKILKFLRQMEMKMKSLPMGP